MGRKLRKSGFNIIGDVPWGTHFCNFYQTKQDLLDMLLPFFTAGLESNEFCLWVVSNPLDEQEARDAARNVIHNFDSYFEKGQIEIIPYTSWYYRNGELCMEKLFDDWIQIMENAISRGFDGLRATGNTAWLEKKDWGGFLEYERILNEMIGQVQMIVLCSYALPHCRASDVINVVNSHRFALLIREGRWEMIETSQHRKTEQALRDSEEKFRVLTETAACGICIIQEDSICYANSEAERITGYSKEGLSKIKIWELVHPDHRGFLQRVASENKNILSGREIKILSKDGQEKWVILSYGAVVIQSKQVILGTFCDITDRKKAEETTRQQLYSSQKMEDVGKLASGMAHEINNQLTVIQAYLDLYASDDSLSFARSKITRVVEKTCKLNRQLMLYSGQRVKSKEPVDLNQNLKDLYEMFNRMLGEDVTVHYELDEDLWMVNADAANIEQVIINLILNARGAMPQGGTITVKTKNVVIDKADHTCQAICLSVSDTGIGMDESVISQIFNPFFTTKDVGKGTGLGLTVVHSIVEAHGGWIDVQSKLGEGSTFMIFLPATNNISYLSGGDSAVPETFRGKGEKILLVEDDPDVVTLTRKVLVENGYVVCICRKVVEALDLFDRNNGNFDLVVSDLVLPDGKGFVLVRLLRERKPELKVLLVSGYFERLIGVSKILQQEYPFLPKPYTAVELLREVHRLLSVHPAQRQAQYMLKVTDPVISGDTVSG